MVPKRKIHPDWLDPLDCMLFGVTCHTAHISQDMKQHSELRVGMTWRLKETIRAPQGERGQRLSEGRLTRDGLGCDASQK